jgi:signal peptidase II
MMRRVGIIAVATFALDQASKLAVVQGLDLLNRGVIEVVPPFLVFRMAWNRGVNFGLFSHDADVMRWVLIAVALSISAWVWLWMRREKASVPAQISAGLLIGGAMGNVIDRIVYGAVADFLNMSCCGIENPYAFNVADIAIFAGAAGLVLFTGQKKGPGKDVPKRNGKTP